MCGRRSARAVVSHFFFLPFFFFLFCPAYKKKKKMLSEGRPPIRNISSLPPSFLLLLLLCCSFLAPERRKIVSYFCFSLVCVCDTVASTSGSTRSLTHCWATSSCWAGGEIQTLFFLFFFSQREFILGSWASQTVCVYVLRGGGTLSCFEFCVCVNVISFGSAS